MTVRRALAAASFTAIASFSPLHAAPLPGEGYVVDGRCVGITRVQGSQVSYEWRDGNASGSGSLPADWLGPRCTIGTATPPQATSPARPAMKPTPETTSRGDAMPPRAPTGATSDTDFARDILRAHNRYRCQHGVPPLEWNDDIAAYARRWIEQAGFKHTDSYRSPLGPMGENLFASSQQPSGAEAAASWYSESEGYDYRREGSPGTGHFTAMIWKDARQLGCARVRGVVSCNYATGSRTMDCAVPNMRGCYVQQVLPVSKDPGACERAP